MSYLFIEKWADFSDLNDNTRDYISNPIFLMYASAIQKSNHKVYYINGNDNELTRTKLLDIIGSEQIKTIIFLANSDNISSIEHLSLSYLNDKEIEVILCSINENLNKYSRKQSDKLKYILFNENLSIKNNLLFFLKSLGLTLNLDGKEECVIDYSIVKNYYSKNAIINIGTGCKAQCSFCNIANSTLNYTSIETLIKEITYLLQNGIKFFHVVNHSFSCDRKFIENFCTQLNEIKEDFDFAWSCYIIPSFFIKNIDLLPLMAKSNLKKIEIGCESGNELLLKTLNLQHTLEDIENIISSAIDQNIFIFTAHFIIGSPKENKETLNDTKEFILKLLDLTNGICDIQTHCFFPMNNKNDEITNRKGDFILGSDFLTIETLNKLRKDLYIDIKMKREKLKNKISFQKQHELYLIEKKYNITSQIGRDYFSKTRNYSLFAQKETIKHASYSWEIPNNYSDYSLIYNFGTFVPLERLNDDYSNFHIVLENYIRCGYSVDYITETVRKETNGSITKETIYSMIKELESQLGLYYIKYLN